MSHYKMRSIDTTKVIYLIPYNFHETKFGCVIFLILRDEICLTPISSITGDNIDCQSGDGENSVIMRSIPSSSMTQDKL